MLQRTYVGPLARVCVDLPTRRLTARRDEVVDVDDLEAGLLDLSGDWATPLTERPAPRRARRTTNRASTPKES